MDYIKPNKKYKYFAATRSGEMPTKHKHDYDSVLPDLIHCRKGWPEKDWAIFRVVFTHKGPKKDDYQYGQIDIKEGNFWQEFMFPTLISDEINHRHPERKISKKAGA